MEEYRQAKSRSAPLSSVESSLGTKRSVATPPSPTPYNLSSSKAEQNQDLAPTGVKRKRKSRWGSEGDRVELPVPSVVIPQMVKPDPDSPALSGTLPCLCVLYIIYIYISERSTHTRHVLYCSTHGPVS